MGLFTKTKDQTSHSQHENGQKDTKDKKPLPDPSYTWGITPTAEHMSTDPYMDKNHPVHKIPLEKQEKMRKKGINPAAKAEMDEALKGEGGFWAKFAGTSMGGGWIK
ncbi:uncharacterized protein LDX57_000058 [Aspergillus melleus]|uniref:uncharacterized protein n=1 Tax=Aspergillus melleus TaxID=138277 RepID=UPI001E8DF2A3|nr:uncharacterized protein LDX57_000058 [Aspergillus melleus]KAH8422300.1 hypothetical protein LDX57_000058 [Aspergillus melleus]